MMKKIRIVLIAAGCSVLIAACQPVQSNDIEYSTLEEYTEAEVEETTAVFSNEELQLNYVKIPALSGIDINIDNVNYSALVDITVQEGDEVGLRAQETHEDGTAGSIIMPTITVGENSFISTLEEQLIGLSLGEQKTITVTVPDGEDYSTYGYYAGETLNVDVLIGNIDRERDKDGIQERIWDQLFSQCTVSGIYEPYSEYFDDVSTALEATAAKAIAYKWGLDEKYEEKEELYELVDYTDSTDEALEFEIYKEIVTDKIIEYFAQCEE